MLSKFSMAIICIALCNSCQNKELNGGELLAKAIAYHDPDNSWATFRDSLRIVMETPDEAVRQSRIYMNLPGNSFYIRMEQDTVVREYSLVNDSCELRLNGRSDFSDEEAASNRLTCEMAGRVKNYYTYLYGLPMKLRDPGTRIQDEVSVRNLNGKTYQVLKATYDPDVGSDVWYFYFHPETYAMEAYQFFRTDSTGRELPESGEYILLSGEVSKRGIKMPKVRAWYYNRDDQLLGTDILE